MTVDTSKLVDACMLLRGSSPGEWDNFVNHVRTYAASIVSEMVRTPPEHLARVQGMAQQAQDFALLLATAPNIYDKRAVNQGLNNARRPNTNWPA